MNVGMSQQIYKDNYGENGALNKSRKWTPNYYDVKKCKYCEEHPSWPYDKLYQMQDLSKGDLWRDWNPRIDSGMFRLPF